MLRPPTVNLANSDLGQLSQCFSCIISGEISCRNIDCKNTKYFQSANKVFFPTKRGIKTFPFYRFVKLCFCALYIPQKLRFLMELSNYPLESNSSIKHLFCPLRQLFRAGLDRDGQRHAGAQL